MQVDIILRLVSLYLLHAAHKGREQQCVIAESTISFEVPISYQLITCYEDSAGGLILKTLLTPSTQFMALLL